MQGIAVGQFVRALLAGGFAAGVDPNETSGDEYRRLGVIVRIDLGTSTVILEDMFNNEHLCWMSSIQHVDPFGMDEFIRDWALRRARELGYAPRRTVEASP